MPVSFDWESPEILKVNYYGIIDGEDAVDASTRMNADPRFDNLTGIIIDTLELTDNIATDEHVGRLLALSKIMSMGNPRIRNALVLNHDETTEALASLYTHLADTLIWKVEMFRSLELAREWVMQPFDEAAKNNKHGLKLI